MCFEQQEDIFKQMLSVVYTDMTAVCVVYVKWTPQTSLIGNLVKRKTIFCFVVVVSFDTFCYIIAVDSF